MYKLEIQTNNTVKRIKDPRNIKVINLFFTSLVRIMDDDGRWTNLGHTFFHQDACIAAIQIRNAASNQKTFVEVDLD